MSVHIRELRPDDRAQWDELWHGYLAFYEKSLPWEVTEATWQRLLDPGVDMHGLCAAEREGRLLGIVHFLYHPVTWSIAPRCYLEDLFVAESARRSGIAARLIEAVYAAADARGADQVYWLTQESNAIARALYDRIGRRTPFIKYQR